MISREMQARFADLPVPSFVVENGVRLGRLKPRTKRWRQLVLFLAQITPDKLENFRQLTQCLLSWGLGGDECRERTVPRGEVSRLGA